jgi:hypothetical protein
LLQAVMPHRKEASARSGRKRSGQNRMGHLMRRKDLRLVQR